MRSGPIIGIVVTAASVFVAWAQSPTTVAYPYAGTWKINLAKSDFGETNVAYEQTSAGEMQFTSSGESYKFRMDGMDYPSLFGATAAWKQIDGSTWEVAIKQHAKLINTATMTLSEDGKTLTTNETGPKQTGGMYHRKTVYSRVSGGPGLVGTWSTKNAPRMPRIVEFVPTGTDGLAIRWPDDKESCEAKFDGRDYPVTGPIAQPAMTLAVQKNSPRSLEIIGKQYAKPFLRVAVTVSDDGKSLTQKGAITGFSERFVVVYDRE